MAVSQVERLKNPCKVTTWNNLVAAQPPSSAPATPITQVKIRPCDLLPGISILASRPAPSPRTIHAIIPITDSSVSDEIEVRIAGPARRVAVGENNSCGLLPFSRPLRFYRADPTKNSGPTLLPRYSQRDIHWKQLPGSGAILLYYPAAALVSTRWGNRRTA